MVALRSVIAAPDPQARGQALLSIGQRLASLIRRFGDPGNPKVNRNRVEIARAIVDAVNARDLSELREQLHLFGSTYEETDEKPERDLADKACRREAEALAALLERPIHGLWDDLRRELSMLAVIRRDFPTPEQIDRGRIFLASDLVINSNLTEQGRAFLAEQIETRRNVWGDPEVRFLGIAQVGNRIMITHSYGLTILDIEPR